MSGYWGVQRPILKYGTSYSTTWNCQTDNVNMNYSYQHTKIRGINHSEITRKNTYVELYEGTEDTDGQVEFWFNDLTDDQVEKLLAIYKYPTIKIQYHADSPNSWDNIFIIKEFRMPAEKETGGLYPDQASAYMLLIKETPDEINNDTTT